MTADVLAASGLRIERSDGKALVDDVSLRLGPGKAIGIVGESGSGKTLISKAVIGVLPPGLSVAAGTIDLFGSPNDKLDSRSWQRLRGSRIAAVFQDPGSYLNPSYTVGAHFTEILRTKLRRPRSEALAVARERLAEVRIADPDRVLKLFPRALSGGMAQRVVLALALLERPDVLIADEITTALDVTVAAEVLDLLLELRAAHGMSMVVVSHDLSVVSRLAETLIVLRDGRIVEAGDTATLLRHPTTDYLRGLVDEYTRLGRVHHAPAD